MGEHLLLPGEIPAARDQALGPGPAGGRLPGSVLVKELRQMSMSIRRRLRGLAASVVLSAAALGALSVSCAQAAVVSVGACDTAPLSQPFLHWADINTYKLAPGGDFEGTLSDWTLSGSAGAASGSEPAGVTGSVGSSSLRLGAGASAQSPVTCVNAAYPTFRFFARSDAPMSLLAVSVVYNTLLGQMTIPVGVVGLSHDWAPTLPMVTGSAVPGLLSDGTAPVALRFTELSGSSQIDDVFVDPHGFH
ncbi:MAG: hypothetical protein QOF77_2359 [Solirubrobacteraceae bacterium]|nr:hypothetical protein [Solirubrobacteraceae bacterium]